jgi:hypothetical protein
MKEQKNRRSVKATIASPTRPDLRTAFVKRVSFLALVLALVLTSVASADDPNLVGWWELDEGEGQTAYDSAGSNDGAIYDATWTTGKFGGALNFDGAGDYVAVSGLDNFDADNNIFSISVWVNPNDDSGTHYVMGENQDGYNKEWNVRISSAGEVMYLYGYSYTTRSTTTSPISFSQWNHVVWVVDQDSEVLKIYVDGEEETLDSSVVENVVVGNAPFRIARDRSGYFDGLIDEVRIYDRALSEQEIQALMQGGAVLDNVALGKAASQSLWTAIPVGTGGLMSPSPARIWRLIRGGR